VRSKIERRPDVRSFIIRRLNSFFWTIVLLLLIGVFPGLAWADAPGKPALTVILERNEILAGQTMSFSVWIENATEAKIINAALSLFGPTFLKIGTLDQSGTCSTKDTIDLGNVDPGSTVARNKLCLQAESSIEERDENLGFSVSYSLQNLKDNKTTAGGLVSEKKVSLGLFGTESIGGVSLRLASYIIPGTLFLMILRLFAPKWKTELGATESVTLSVFISVLLFFLAALVFPSLHLRFAGIGSTVSAIAFLTLCGIAIALAFIGVAVLQDIASKEAQRRNALVVQENDRVGPIIQKALRAANGNFDPVMITAGGREYVGSLAVPTSGGGKILLGWFRLRVPDDTRRSELEECFKNDDFVTPIEEAAQWGIEPTMVDPIKELEAGRLEPTRFLWMYFDEKAARLPAGHADLAGTKPLTLTR
jgi:hypothetical protein